jgi:Spy/CpxP family protein refolding chaperone
MIVHRARWLLLSIAPLVALGCDKTVGDAPPPTGSASASLVAATASASAAPSGSARKPRGMFGRHGGIAGSLFRAAHELDLKEGKTASLDALEVGLKADDEGVRAAMKAFRADLIAGIRTGKLDTPKLAADNVVIDKAIADHQAKEAEALDSLHALLDSTQRTALVESVRTRQTEREARMGRWMLAKEADGGAPDWAKRRLDKLTDDLVLDAGQQKQVAALFVKANDPPGAVGMKSRWDNTRARLDALLTAFAGDAFDARKADLTVLPGKTAHEPMEHMATFFSQLLPILRIDQRSKLATDLDKPFGVGGGPGARGGPQGRGPADDIVFPFEEPVDRPAGGPPGLAQ